ncbi:MAG: outer membrane beta-barrel protein, partial [Phenylobacterium sp.]|uniref:outer membrane protein n=1 Tax=Phenylobacterium sp. TaxID=1871053 RepID=UPI0027184C8F
MKFKLLAGAALAVTTLAATGAAAQDSGWYGAVDVGYHWSDNVKQKVGLGSYAIDPEDSWTGFARLGYRLSPSWRVEMEGGWRPGDLESPPFDAMGQFEVLSLMGNVVYDFMPDANLHPFLGLGAGYARAYTTQLRVPSLNVDEADGAWAWQALAGLTAKASDRMNVDLTYRYFQTDDFEFGNVGTGGPVSGAYNDQSVTVGI